MGIILSLSLVRSISKILGSGEKVVEAEKQVLALENEKKDLNEKFNALSSITFVEKEARDKLGLAKKGEIVVILPDADKLREIAPKLEDKKYSLPDPIWKKWMKLFL